MRWMIFAVLATLSEISVAQTDPTQNMPIAMKDYYALSQGQNKVMATLPSFNMYKSSSNGSYALLGGNIVKVGDEIPGGFKVVQMTKDKIVLQAEHGGQQIVLNDSLLGNTASVIRSVKNGGQNASVSDS